MIIEVQFQQEVVLHVQHKQLHNEHNQQEHKVLLQDNLHKQQEAVQQVAQQVQQDNLHKQQEQVVQHLHVAQEVPFVQVVHQGLVVLHLLEVQEVRQEDDK
jgi:hypothetical protein